MLVMADLSNFSVHGVESYLKKQLFWKSKQTAKETGFKFYWNLNGDIFERKSENDKPILIKNDQDFAFVK